CSATPRADPLSPPVQNLLHQHHRGGNAEGEWGRRVMRSAYLANGENGNSDRRAEEKNGDDGGGERLRLSVTVGMILVGGTGGNAQAAPHDQRREYVGGRFDRVGDE